MTASELRKLFNDKFGPNQKWPATYEVDHETYANVCQAVFEHQSGSNGLYWDTIKVAIGLVNKGIMFKNVELILRSKG